LSLNVVEAKRNRNSFLLQQDHQVGLLLVRRQQLQKQLGR
jgi:hypothetical protein